MTDNERRQVFNDLYMQYERRVYAYCLYVIGDKDQANDVFQEVFVKVFKSLHTVQELDKASHWLFRIARNECINAMKFNQRSDRRSVRIDGDTPAYVRENAIDADEMEHLHWAINQLSEDHREALLLAEFEGFSMKEISDLTGASIANVKVRIHRAKQRLHKLLEPILQSHG
jgi:RNA polymerase sigma-70 factor, ECF subfamily